MKGKIVYFAVFALYGYVWALPSNRGVLLVFSFLILYLLFKLPKPFLSLSILIFFLFYFYGNYKESQQISLYSGEESRFQLTISPDMTVDGDLLKATVKTDRQEKLKLYYRIPSEQNKEQIEKFLPHNRSCLIQGTLKKPNGIRNENGFQFEKFLNQQQIFWILEPQFISLSSCKPAPRSILSTLFEWRHSMTEIIKEDYPDELKGIAAALLFGDRSLAEDELLTAYQRLGIIHLLAISGLHVGLISGALFYILIRMGITKEYANIILLIFLPIYAIVAGGSPPVIRATLMTIVVLLSLQRPEKWTPLDALSCSLLIVLILQPYLIYHVGFQLSYAVSFSLILSSTRIIPIFQTLFSKMFAITVISQTASIPIMLFHFFEISFLSLITNLFFVPFYAFIVLPFILGTFLLQFFLPGIMSLLPVFMVIVQPIHEVAIRLSQWKYATIITGIPNDLLLALYIMATICAFIIWEKKRGLIYGSFVVVLTIVFHLFLPFCHPQGEVNFIDIGQGDSILVRLPYSKGTYLIDTGGVLPFKKEHWKERQQSFSIGEDVLIPYFKSKGITQIDKLILTHSDYDHIGASIEIMEHLKIKEIIISPGSEAKAVMKNIIHQAQRREIPVQYGIAGQSWTVQGAFFSFLHPADTRYEGNDDSLVLYMELGGKTWLLTGDLEKEGEEDLVKRYHVNVDILKVGHHGSRTSTTEPFLDMLSPSYAIISVGKGNRYGHPHREVMESLKKRRVKMLRTDEHGEISYKFYGQKGTFFIQSP
ncbi:competence protein ComEC [Oikeobacillus pervagus]|uniref:Competence protein ComEC n=1 Tax=Oikeobacillus pervagus TaxID=1325931 RepID=A0AAJ1T1E1_9BACI|nr:DNA internalization-related competence protein ComEC/Rec2 [Oikeobacillus pervagus]MDQ0216803.1 competence protein ComEC [Oikeobacillus pervagus]